MIIVISIQYPPKKKQQHNLKSHFVGTKEALFPSVLKSQVT